MWIKDSKPSCELKSQFFFNSEKKFFQQKIKYKYKREIEGIGISDIDGVFHVVAKLESKTMFKFSKVKQGNKSKDNWYFWVLGTNFSLRTYGFILSFLISYEKLIFL